MHLKSDWLVKRRSTYADWDTRILYNIEIGLVVDVFGDTLNFGPRSSDVCAFSGIPFVAFDGYYTVALLCKFPWQMTYSSSNINDLLRRYLVKFRHLLEKDYQGVEFVILLRSTAVPRSLCPFWFLRRQVLTISGWMIVCIHPLSLLKHRLHRHLTARLQYRLWESESRQVEVCEKVS